MTVTLPRLRASFRSGVSGPRSIPSREGRRRVIDPVRLMRRGPSAIPWGSRRSHGYVAPGLRQARTPARSHRADVAATPRDRDGRAVAVRGPALTSRVSVNLRLFLFVLIEVVEVVVLVEVIVLVHV